MHERRRAALQRRASFWTRKGRCSTSNLCMILAGNRFRFSLRGPSVRGHALADAIAVIAPKKAQASPCTITPRVSSPMMIRCSARPVSGGAITSRPKRWRKRSAKKPIYSCRSSRSCRDTDCSFRHRICSDAVHSGVMPAAEPDGNMPCCPQKIGRLFKSRNQDTNLAPPLLGAHGACCRVIPLTAGSGLPALLSRMLCGAQPLIRPWSQFVRGNDRLGLRGFSLRKCRAHAPAVVPSR